MVRTKNPEVGLPKTVRRCQAVTKKRSIEGVSNHVGHKNKSVFAVEGSNQWYNTHKKNKFIVELRWCEFVGEHLPIMDHFGKLGWDNILRLDFMYYPDLVRQFYSNIEGKESKQINEIVSHVKGVKVVINNDLIAELFGVSKQGGAVRVSGSQVLSDPEFSLEAAMVSLGLKKHTKYSAGTRLGTRKILKAGDLAILPRLLAFVLAFNFCPHKSPDELRVREVYLVYKLLNGLGSLEGIPLGNIIVSKIMDVVTSKRPGTGFCYPVLLSNILVKLQVPIDEQDEKIVVPKDHALNETKMMQLGYRRDSNDVWYKGRPDKVTSTSTALVQHSGGASQPDGVQEHLQAVQQGLENLTREVERRGLVLDSLVKYIQTKKF